MYIEHTCVCFYNLIVYVFKPFVKIILNHVGMEARNGEQKKCFCYYAIFVNKNLH